MRWASGVTMTEFTSTKGIPAILAFDCGNSAVKMAAVCGETIAESQSFAAPELAGLADAIRILWDQLPEPRRAVACSVNPAILARLEEELDEAVGEVLLVVGRDLELPMKIAFDDCDTVGVDRICAAVGAYDHLGTACVVGDFGSAVTFDAVSDEGKFLGGAILPGCGLQLRALANETAQLPEVEIAEPTHTFGQSTADAIRNGIINGLRGAMRYFVEAYATEMGNWPLVILTGGDARLIGGDVEDSDLVQAIVDDLVLRGVAIAYYKFMLK